MAGAGLLPRPGRREDGTVDYDTIMKLPDPWGLLSQVDGKQEEHGEIVVGLPTTIVAALLDNAQMLAAHAAHSYDNEHARDAVEAVSGTVVFVLWMLADSIAAVAPTLRTLNGEDPDHVVGQLRAGYTAWDELYLAVRTANQQRGTREHEAGISDAGRGSGDDGGGQS
jgi:hypothetical protein